MSTNILFYKGKEYRNSGFLKCSKAIGLVFT